MRGGELQNVPIVSAVIDKIVGAMVRGELGLNVRITKTDAIEIFFPTREGVSFFSIFPAPLENVSVETGPAISAASQSRSPEEKLNDGPDSALFLTPWQMCALAEAIGPSNDCGKGSRRDKAGAVIELAMNEIAHPLNCGLELRLLI